MGLDQSSLLLAALTSRRVVQEVPAIKRIPERLKGSFALQNPVLQVIRRWTRRRGLGELRYAFFQLGSQDRCSTDWSANDPLARISKQGNGVRRVESVPTSQAKPGLVDT
jgi:hypothetical protein